MRLQGEHRVRLIALLIGATSLIFAAGFYAGAHKVRDVPDPIVVERMPDNETNFTPEFEKAQEGEGEAGKGEVVASVNSDKYHFLSCPGASQINEENKIFFGSAGEAQAAGLTLAGNCRE